MHVSPDRFGASGVAGFYESFPPVTDAEVVAILSRNIPAPPDGAAAADAKTAPLAKPSEAAASASATNLKPPLVGFGGGSASGGSEPVRTKPPLAGGVEPPLAA